MKMRRVSGSNGDMERSVNHFRKVLAQSGPHSAEVEAASENVVRVARLAWGYWLDQTPEEVRERLAIDATLLVAEQPPVTDLGRDPRLPLVYLVWEIIRPGPESISDLHGVYGSLAAANADAAARLRVALAGPHERNRLGHEFRFYVQAMDVQALDVPDPSLHRATWFFTRDSLNAKSGDDH